MNPNNVAIFVFYDKKGIVDRYVLFMLQELLKVVNRLIIVCNGEPNNEGKLVFESLTKEVFIRENKGLDAWAYKYGMENIGWENLKEYDNLILLNDTVYGPFYPFETIFDEMKSRNVDFWGITKHGESIDYSGLALKNIYPEHIQSYFYVIGKKMLSSPGFKQYWVDLPEFNSWTEAIAFHEVVFTKHFEDLGFTWDAYVNTDKKLEDYSDIAQIHQMIFELVRDYKCPVIKRKNFSIDYGNFFFLTLGDGSEKALDYIQKNTNYNTDLIREHILRTANLRYIKDNMHLNYILPERYVYDEYAKGDAPVDISGLKIALFIHLENEDRIELISDYVASMPENADILVTTTSENKKDIITGRFDAIKCAELKVFVLPEETGANEISSLWVALKPYMSNYDYICFVHDKKKTHIKPETIDRNFTQRYLENTLASKEYVKNVIVTFFTHPGLGLLFPPPANHAIYGKFSPSQVWGDDYESVKVLAEKLNIDVPIGEEAVFSAIGGMFWFKPDALKKLIEFDWDYKDFLDGEQSSVFEKIYTFAAQSEDYYSAWILTDEFASTEITSLFYLLTQIHPGKRSGLSGLVRYFVIVHLQRYPKIYDFVRKIYRFSKKVKRKLRGAA